jgi:hypothetical protein
LDNPRNERPEVDPRLVFLITVDGRDSVEGASHEATDMTIPIFDPRGFVPRLSRSNRHLIGRTRPRSCFLHQFGKPANLAHDPDGG